MKFGLCFYQGTTKDVHYLPTPWGDKRSQILMMTMRCIPETILSNFAIRNRSLDSNLSFVMTPNGSEGMLRNKRKGVRPNHSLFNSIYRKVTLVCQPFYTRISSAIVDWLIKSFLTCFLNYKYRLHTSLKKPDQRKLRWSRWSCMVTVNYGICLSSVSKIFCTHLVGNEDGKLVLITRSQCKCKTIPRKTFTQSNVFLK